MPDQRSVMKEFRSLEHKRASEGLTAAEEARLAELRELIGHEAGAGGLQGGFDVGAAAARLRESLLPAGLRNRPPPAPEPEPEAPPEPDLSPAEALAGAYAEEPFAPLELAPPSDPLFDPSSLGLDAPQAAENAVAPEWDPGGGTYDPNAPGYDPNVAAYDPNATAYDPNAAAYDPNAAAYDPNAAAYDPNAAAYAPDPQAYADAGAPQGYDPSTWQGDAAADAQASWEPGAAVDPNAPAWDPNQPPAWDPNQPSAWDPNQPFDPAAGTAQDAVAPGGWDPNAPFDPNAAPWDASASTGAAPAWDPSQPFDPNAPYAPPYDPSARPYGAEAEEWTAGPPADDGAAAADAQVDAAFEAALFGEPDAAAVGPDVSGEAAALPPDGWDVAPPAPDPAAANAPMGEYDETGGGLPAGEDAGPAAMDPLDAGAEPFLEAGVDAAAGSPVLGEYDDTAGFAGAAFPDAVPADLTPEEGGFEAARAVAPAESEGWHPEPAVDAGFRLESGGSFDAADAAVAPEWALAAEPAPWGGADAAAGADPGTEPEQPEGAAPADAPGEIAEPSPELPSLEVDVFEPEEPSLASTAGEVGPAVGDLGLDTEAAAPELSGPAPALDFSRPDLSADQPDDDFTMPPPPPAAAATEEDLPTIDGEEILEEVAVSEEPAPPLDFEPLVVAPAPPPSPTSSEPAPEPAAVAPPPAPTVAHVERFVEGVHRVVVHTVEGQVKRGVLENPDLAGASLGLAAQPGGEPELVPTDKVKAIFFMLAAGERAPAAEGKKVRVTFRDGRQIAGFSPDYDETGPGFFMVPGDTRTNTGRIWVFRASVKQVTVS